MKTQVKEQIKFTLKTYCKRFESQNEAANSLNGVSRATVSQVLNDNWELVSDGMWRNLSAQIGYTDSDWEIVETSDFKITTKLLSDAQRHSNTLAIVGNAGSGKTVAIKKYVAANSNAYALHCSEFWNRKHFLAELLAKMGRDYSGLTVAEMMQEAVRVLQKKETPILIFDEADKLTDQVLYFFITLYNNLEDKCGIVLLSTDHLSKRIKRGIKFNKKGYKEIYSRIGRRFIELSGLNATDVAQVCIANGIADKATIKDIWKGCEYDLRRVKRLIHANKMKINK